MEEVWLGTKAVSVETLGMTDLGLGVSLEQDGVWFPLSDTSPS